MSLALGSPQGFGMTGLAGSAEAGGGTSGRQRCLHDGVPAGRPWPLAPASLCPLASASSSGLQGSPSPGHGPRPLGDQAWAAGLAEVVGVVAGADEGRALCGPAFEWRAGAHLHLEAGAATCAFIPSSQSTRTCVCHRAAGRVTQQTPHPPIIVRPSCPRPSWGSQTPWEGPIPISAHRCPHTHEHAHGARAHTPTGPPEAAAVVQPHIRQVALHEVRAAHRRRSCC